METMRTRATDLLPSLLLTVLSMVQALALELLWTRLRESPFLWAGDWGSLLGWGQVVAMLLGMSVVWLFYVSLVLRFTWLPTVSDSIIPFVIGLLEFTMIELMGPESLGPWFYNLALIFAVSPWASQKIFKRARQHEANREFFEAVSPASMRDYAPAVAAVAVLALFGMILQLSGSQGWLALCGILVAITALALQIKLLHHFWTLSLLGPSGAETADSSSPDFDS